MRRHVSEVGDGFLVGLRVFGCIAFAILCSRALGVEDKAVPQFRQNIQPLLAKYCYDCHGDGMNKGKVAFDELTSNDALLNPDLWLKVIKNVRAGLMPPQKNPRPTSGEVKRLEDWIKSSVFKIDPKNLDPGRVTVRRLNRVEYRNTIRDLIGFDYDTQIEFPPDDTGNGFDNNGDVLTLSPMLLDKYLNAVQTIVSKTVPVKSKVLAEKIINGGDFDAGRGDAKGALSLSYYETSSVSNTFQIEHAGRHQLVL